ncbi:Kinesin-3 [Giardia muris]|uniref:Kinesin-3 n=1 Tax=Giardia muris TaxID=5742 RepID=A0A4Z1SV63_GIAMU|nr:Kinesin-3 [Giardia muris]|eukprot:TNJ27478.1 Kinesin-3 [Giardia muris]
MPVTGVKVAVRIRPFNDREKKEGAALCVDMPGGGVVAIEDKGHETRFTYDHAYWSHDNSRPLATQETVYKDIGEAVLDNALEGYNYTLFAYGQTGSGKSYSMMGSSDEPGIIPRVGCALFERVAAAGSDGPTFEITCSFLEIYNEKLADLLVPRANQKELKIRQDPKTGIFVSNLSSQAVASYDQVSRLIALGDKNRTVASTNMNATSSRSHSVFTLVVTQRTELTNDAGESVGTHVKKAQITLVDLAGSERQDKTGATGDRLQEGININQSLTTLGRVIEALAYNATPAGQKKPQHVPYRDSQLTYLLQDALGGNAMTCMIAAISPASTNYDESLSTLKYADRAKQIKNTVSKNESAQERYIKELEDRVKELEAQLAAGGVLPSEGGETTSGDDVLTAEERADLEEQLAEYERRLKEQSKSFDEKLLEAEQNRKDLIERLTKLGIETIFGSEVTVPHLTNLNSDASLNQQLAYRISQTEDLKEGRETRTVVGAGEATSGEYTYRIALTSALGVPLEAFVLRSLNSVADSTEYPIFPKCIPVYITALTDGCPVFLNGRKLERGNERPLHHGDRIRCGSSATTSFYKYVDPIARAAALKRGIDDGYDYIEPDITYDLALREYERRRGEDDVARPEIQPNEGNIEDQIDAAFGVSPDEPDAGDGFLDSQLLADCSPKELLAYKNLGALYPAICEANAMAEFFDYDITFRATARTSIKPPTILLARQARARATKDICAPVTEEEVILEVVVTAVCLTSSKERVTRQQIWPLEKFWLRLQGMRSMYGAAMEFNDKQRAIQEAHESADRDLEDDDEFPFDLDADIYNQKLPHLIGVARIPLEGLREASETGLFEVPVYNYAGEEVARTEVGLVLHDLSCGCSHDGAACLAFQCEGFMKSTSPMTILGVYFKRLYGLPSTTDRRAHILVHMPWFINEDSARPQGKRMSPYRELEFRRYLLSTGAAISTPPCNEASCSPVIDATIPLDIPMREDVVQWLGSDAAGLEVSVYAYTSEYSDGIKLAARSELISTAEEPDIKSTDIVRTQRLPENVEEMDGALVIRRRQVIFVDLERRK